MHSISPVRPSTAPACRAARVTLALVLALAAAACGPGTTTDAGGAETSSPPPDAPRDAGATDASRMDDGVVRDVIELDTMAPPRRDAMTSPDAPGDTPGPDAPSPRDGASDAAMTDSADPGDGEVCPVSASITLCNTLMPCDPATYMASCIDGSRLRACEPVPGAPGTGTIWHYYCPSLGGMCRACRADLGECMPGSEFVCAP